MSLRAACVSIHFDCAQKHTVGLSVLEGNEADQSPEGNCDRGSPSSTSGQHQWCEGNVFHLEDSLVICFLFGAAYGSPYVVFILCPLYRFMLRMCYGYSVVMATIEKYITYTTKEGLAG